MKKVWYSAITSDMVSHLSPEDKDELYEQLNDAVMEICSTYEVR